jgi:hypothetical protein
MCFFSINSCTSTRDSGIFITIELINNLPETKMDNAYEAFQKVEGARAYLDHLNRHRPSRQDLSDAKEQLANRTKELNEILERRGHL